MVLDFSPCKFGLLPSPTRTTASYSYSCIIFLLLYPTPTLYLLSLPGVTGRQESVEGGMQQDTVPPLITSFSDNNWFGFLHFFFF